MKHDKYKFLKVKSHKIFKSYRILINVLAIEYIKTVNTFSNVTLVSNIGRLISHYSPQMYFSLLKTKESFRDAFKIIDVHIDYNEST